MSEESRVRLLHTSKCHMYASPTYRAYPPHCRRCRHTQERYSRKNETQHLRTAFDLLDGNRRGQIGAEELRAYFESAGHKAKKVLSSPASSPGCSQCACSSTCSLPHPCCSLWHLLGPAHRQRWRT